MNFLFDIIKGMLIGVANIIPGVSGGTMMVSMGVYEKIIGVVNNLFKDIKKSILTLLPLGIGMLLGVAVFSFIIPWCLEVYPLPTSLCFIGLIWVVYQQLLSQQKKVFTKKERVFLFHTLLHLYFSLL